MSFNRFGLANCLLLGFFVTTMSAATITASEARQHIGEKATVCGVVAGVHTTSKIQGNPTFVNLDKPYPNQVFTILIWGSDYTKFRPAPSSWDGKRVCATGLISSYPGGPEIIARSGGDVSFPR